jgi:hypothetical protein
VLVLVMIVVVVAATRRLEGLGEGVVADRDPDRLAVSTRGAEVERATSC